MKVFISKDFSFEAAHHLPGHEGHCLNIHGHSYKGTVVISGEVQLFGDLQKYMVMDYSDLKKIINDEIIHNYDHQNLNDFWVIPTAENMVGTFFNNIRCNLSAHYPNVKLERVELKETEHSKAWVEAE